MVIETMPISNPALSRREAQVLELIARGFIDKQMAAALGLTVGTLRVYRKRLLSKLGTRGSVQTVLVAWKLGLLDLDVIAEEALAVSGSGTSRPGR